jgi:hypothetical protein
MLATETRRRLISEFDLVTTSEIVIDIPPL